MSATRGQILLSVIASEEFTAAEVPSAATVSERTLKSGAGNQANLSLSSTTTPSLTKAPISQKITIGGGITTIDLTAAAVSNLPPSATRTVDMTGAKLVAFSLRADSANVAAVNVAPGAADPYPLFGTGNDIDVEPDEQIAGSFRGTASAKPAVAAAVKDIDISGTSGDILYIDLLFGT